MGQRREQGNTVKRYYWLKLKEEFFLDKEVKKLRKIAGGDTYTIIYLKLMLLSLKSDGRLYFDGIEDTFHEELALEMDEDPENVRVTMMYLERMGLLKIVEEDEIYLTQMENLIDSESESAQRVREHRARKKQAEIGIEARKPEEITEVISGLPQKTESEALHSNIDVTECNDTETSCNTYTDTDTESETDIKTKQKKKKVFLDSYDFSEHEIVQSAFDDFLAMRIAKKKPMTERAITNLKAKLCRLSSDPKTQAAILDQSTFKTWDDVYQLNKDFVSERVIASVPKITPMQPSEQKLSDEEWERLVMSDKWESS